MSSNVPSTTFNTTAWWFEPGMTSIDDVADVAKARGVFRSQHLGDMVGMSEVPMVQVEAHGGPWLIYPDPLSVLGWVAEQIEPTEDELVTAVDGQGDPLVGWLGCGDLEADRIVGNLLDSEHLPVDLHLREPFISTRHLRAPTPRPAELDGDVIGKLAGQIRVQGTGWRGHHLWVAAYVESLDRLYPDPVELAREVRHVLAAYRVVSTELQDGAPVHETVVARDQGAAGVGLVVLLTLALLMAGVTYAAGVVDAARTVLSVAGVLLSLALLGGAAFGLWTEHVGHRQRMAAFDAGTDRVEPDDALVEAKMRDEWRISQRRVLGVWVTESWVWVDPPGQMRTVHGIQSLNRAAGRRRMLELVREEIVRDGGEFARAESARP